MAKKKPAPTKVESIRHKDKRKNIPTEELRDFVAEDEHAPKTMLYPRDPSLDPQLVWQGKDEQDRGDLAVPVVPIYIQEKIHPQAIIDALPRIEQAGEKQLDLFADFNGLPAEFDQRVDFYKHDGHWSNRMILGDSLLVMTSLAEKEGLKGKVQTIYIDPPYGIKFGSNWQVSTRKRDVKDGKAEDATRQPEQVRAFRDTWQLGIHSYLAYLRDRLVVARDLLTETGSLFVQIGDENMHLVRSVMDEVFGSENYCGQIVFRKTTGKGSQLLDNTYDAILWFAKDKPLVKYRPLYEERNVADEDNLRFIELPDSSRRRMTDEEVNGTKALPTGSRIYRPNPLTNQRPAQGNDLRAYVFDGKQFTPGAGTFRTDKAGLDRLNIARRLLGVGSSLTFIRYLDDFAFKPRNDIWDDTRSGGYGEDKVYVVQTNSKVIERCLLMTTDPGDLVLDPTCGSGTTAYVAEQWGRRWITCDTSRVALALARTRLMAAKYPYYLLADSPEGRKKERELQSEPEASATDAATTAGGKKTVADASGSDGNSPDIRKGFVYRRVPHVTLKSIANNPDIKEGMTRPQIDTAIAKHAETETLYDQPYEDNKRVRVCGPFSVESLSPHRTISAEEKKQISETGQAGWRMRTIGPDTFGQTILENLRKAGVQNTRKGERLKFDSLDVYPGEWIHGAGTYTENVGRASQPVVAAGGEVKPGESTTGRAGKPVLRRAAVCIGPEHGTVGATLIKEAAKETVQGVGFDVLIVCGFAFDPSVSEEAKRYGKLVVLPTKMNPDLAMGDELLKKTGAGNLFMVFGEPDVEVRHVSEPRASASGPLPHGRGSEKLVVEIKGLDVYDPTTGAIRNSSTDDIACWFIDTDYNGESFFVRHAYFTGADEPYDKLKRALRADIDEAAWSSLYSTTSRPFAKPASGRIAVKVINHYGDEVLKVFKV